MTTTTQPAVNVDTTPKFAEGTLNANIPDGPIQDKWDKRLFEMKLVNPANKRKFTIIMVGSGLAGASASAAMAELGYNIECFCYQDSPRRAHCQWHTFHAKPIQRSSLEMFHQYFSAASRFESPCRK